jgi:hypothetical protein
MSKKTSGKANHSWWLLFEKAGHMYIDPVMKKKFTIEYSTINSESQIQCISENICYSIFFVIPSFPMFFVANGQRKHSKRIKSKEISPELEQIEKEYNKKMSAVSISKWMRESEEGKYNQYINGGMRIIADYLKKKTNVL